MAVTIMRQETTPESLRAIGASYDSLSTYTLSDEDGPEVLAFLAARPLHTVFMASLIQDNGVVNSRNRGRFYGCRDKNGDLEGVALIGHATLIEAPNGAAMSSFARLAQQSPVPYLIRGEEDEVSCFWNTYSESTRTPRRVSRELLLELTRPTRSLEPVQDLRRATMADIESIMRVNASMAFDESGSDPQQRDPEGFRQRTARRIEQGRIWVWVKDKRLIFKADIVAETSRVIYIEGVYVDPGERGQGHGRRCMNSLGEILLNDADSICLTVNEQMHGARAFYQKIGYEVRSLYDTIYLEREMAN
jgi:hypothetical protein